jgi:hypothetical protein
MKVVRIIVKILSILLLALVLMAATLGSTDNWPTKPVKLPVGWQQHHYNSDCLFDVGNRGPQSDKGWPLLEEQKGVCGPKANNELARTLNPAIITGFYIGAATLIVYLVTRLRGRSNV